ncbi:MAG TPA: DUF952 domain-containing protein, partial [Candidatus Saccharimonadales bacterium]|nr:DUF952 domain-containing protein [Candidatus Saccharimonadales bacterium]
YLSFDAECSIIRLMKTIICITTRAIWDHALKSGEYTHSTITSSLGEVGFIHATTPDQTMDVIPRFTGQKDVILLLIDVEKVKSAVKFEAARSGREGLFPHIYGPLNIDAVYSTVSVDKDAEGTFVAPAALTRLQYP